MAKGLSSTVRICDAVSLKLWQWSLVTGHEIAKSCIAFAAVFFMTNTLKITKLKQLSGFSKLLGATVTTHPEIKKKKKL